MLELQIGLLGGFRVRVGPREVADAQWRLRKSRNLVELLALAPGHRLPRERVRHALWPALPPAAADDRLGEALEEARRTLDPDPAVARRYLAAGAEFALGPRGAGSGSGPGLQVDVEEFERAALRARRRRDPRSYERAVDRYGGDLLPEDRYEEWAVEPERALHAEYLALLVELGALRGARGDLAGAAAALERAVAADPLHEEASLALMRVHALAGRRHGVLREYARLAAALERATEGAERPGPAARRLRERVRTGGEVRAELAGELWEETGDRRLRCGDGAGAVAAYGCALREAVADLPASPGVATLVNPVATATPVATVTATGPEATATGPAPAAAARSEPAIPSDPAPRVPPAVGLRAARLHRKAAAAHLAGAGAAAAGPHLVAAEQALARAGGDPAEGGRLLAVRAALLSRRGQHEEAAQTADRALAAAVRHGTPEDAVVAAEALALAHHRGGTWRRALRREVELFGADGDTGGGLARVPDLYGCLGQFQLHPPGPEHERSERQRPERQRPAHEHPAHEHPAHEHPQGESPASAAAPASADVEQYARELLGLAVARGARRAEAFAWCLLGESLLLRGSWDEAPGCLERSAHLSEEFGGGAGAAARLRLAEYETARGDSGAAAHHLRQGTAAVRAAPPGRHLTARLYAAEAFDAVERGEPAEAVRAARSAALWAERHGECPSCAAPLYPLAAEAYAALGDTVGAAVHAGAARSVAARRDGPVWRAMARSATASVAAARGDRSAARAGHLAAAGLYERAGRPYWAARSAARALLDGAGGHGGPGARDVSDQELRAWAVRAFEALGARRALAALGATGAASATGRTA